MPIQNEVVDCRRGLAEARREPYSVLIADGHPIVREGLAALINRRSDMRVVAEASNGTEAVDKYMTHSPDVALLEISLPLMDGIETVRSICEKTADAHLVVFTTYLGEDDIYRALRAGAFGYLLKNTSLDDLVQCILAVAQGDRWISPLVSARLVKRVHDRDLTARETEVMRAVAKGKCNKEIGALLNISESTVKVHMTHIFEKLKVGGRTEAINAAVRRGLVRIAQTDAA
jgi:DNA-binding NarL/FixJ family response regulator